MAYRDEIPKNAKRVFEGKIFDVYQWKQRMFDGSEKTFEVLRRPNNVQVLAVIKSKILIQEQEQPGKGRFISLPGGRVEPGEENLIAAKRELEEESGYISDDWILWQRFQPVVRMAFDVSIFVARNCVKKGTINLESGEKISNKLLSFNELVQLSDKYEEFRQKEWRVGSR
jgi:8-oxo-dGTP pyrophosphatase MutT (NUDIX family)